MTFIELKARIRTIWQETKLYFRLLYASMFRGQEVCPIGRLYAIHLSPTGGRTKLGLVSTKVVTDGGVGFIVDAMQGLATIANLKFHGSGTGVAAESAANTALGTEVGTRGSGTQLEGASANIYRTVATLTYSSTLAITEHGLFTASTGPILFDRSVFAAINVISGDSIEFTYELTLPSGS